MKELVQSRTTAAMFLFLKTAVLLLLTAGTVPFALSDNSDSAHRANVAAQTQSHSQGPAGGSHEAFVRVKHNSVDVQSNCLSPTSRFNITPVEDRAVLISLSYTGSDEREDVTSFRCWVYMTSPANTVMSLLRLDRKCDGRGFVVVSDTQSQRRWRLCASVWFAPGLDFTTSSNVANVTIAVNDVSVSYVIDINTQVLSKPMEKELEVRYLSATQGEKLIKLD